MSRKQVVQAFVVFIGFCVWIWLFSCGLTLPSADLLHELRTSQALFSAARLRWILTNTVTNSAILCLIMGFVGAVYRLLISSKATSPPPPTLSRAVANGMIRSFMMYVFVISGSLVIVGEPFQDIVSAGPERYARIAAILSVFSFLAGWQPEFFGRAARVIGAVQWQENG